MGTINKKYTNAVNIEAHIHFCAGEVSGKFLQSSSFTPIHTHTHTHVIQLRYLTRHQLTGECVKFCLFASTHLHCRWYKQRCGPHFCYVLYKMYIKWTSTQAMLFHLWKYWINFNWVWYQGSALTSGEFLSLVHILWTKIKSACIYSIMKT